MPDSIAVPERLNLARYCLGRAAAATPDKTALIVIDDPAGAAHAERWTYSELDLVVRQMAAGLLAEGLAPGDRLLLRMPNSSDYAIVFFGAIAAGLVPIPISPQLTDRETAFLLQDSDANAIAQAELRVTGPKVFDPTAIARLKGTAPLPGYADTDAEGPAYMIYTSGTGSRPKGVVHAHRVVPGREPMRREWEALRADDVMLHAGAFNWSFTLGVGLLDPWCEGATAVLYTGATDIKIWPRLIRATRATIFAAVPSLYRQILKYCAVDSADFARLRHCLAAGESLSPAILSHWEQATGKNLYESLGMSECSTFVSSGPTVRVRPGSAGKPQTGRRVSVLPIGGGVEPVETGEVGLLAIHRKERGLMLGYWRRPDEDAATTRGDWFVGGDLAAFDRDGYLWFHGRADDVMNASGFRVSPLEVESALADCRGLAEVAVAERRVRPDVSVIAAFVVRSDETLDADAVLAHAKERLAPYKLPREVIFVDALPRSANGKLLRRELSLRAK